MTPSQNAGNRLGLLLSDVFQRKSNILACVKPLANLNYSFNRYKKALRYVVWGADFELVR
jgi:hypothetical protein